MLTIYVKDKNKKWQNLDLFNDESVQMEHKASDIKELGKAYSTFTQSFSLPASPTNNTILNYYFDVNIKDKIQYYDAQIHINDIKYRVGRLAVTAGKYIGDKLTTYNITFYSGIKPLKELIGDDSLKDLDYDNINLEWNIDNVCDIINGVTNPIIKIPLISTNRAWNVDNADANNILTNPIIIGELRPAISIKTILEKIENKYAISLDFAPNIQKFIDKMYIWANKESDEVNQIQLIPHQVFDITQSPTNRPNFDGVNKYPDIIKTQKGFKIIETASPNITNCQLNFTIINPRSQLTNERYEDLLNIRLIEVDANGNKINETIIDCQLQADYNHIGVASFQNKNRTKYFEAYAYAKEDITIEKYHILIKAVNMDVYNTSTNTRYMQQRTSWNNIPAPTINYYNFSKSLDFPIEQFLSSLIKTFNIKILEDKNEIYKMKWLSKFHHQPIDITEYVDGEEINVETQQRYKSITLTHGEVDYLRNEAFRDLMGKEYGAEIYETDSIDVSETFEIKTDFNIHSYINIPNTNIVTSYGFDSDLKAVDPDSPTIFFINDTQQMWVTNDVNNKVDLLLNYGNATRVIDNYVPFQNTDGFNDFSTKLSLTFNNEVFAIDNEICDSTLFSKFYKLDFMQIYHPNVFINNYTAYLPPHILNQISMENTLVIGDKKFTIYEMSIDINTGKSQLKLLNYYKEFDEVFAVYSPFIGAQYLDVYPLKFQFFINSGVGNIQNDVELSHYNIRYKNIETGVTTEFQFDFLPNQSQVGYADSGAGTFEVSAQSVTVDGAYSNWSTPAIVVTVPEQSTGVLYPPFFNAYYNDDNVGRFNYTINSGIDNINAGVVPTHYRIEWINTENGASDTSTITAFQNQSQIGYINTGAGNFNVRAQIIVNQDYSIWCDIINVIVQ